MCVWSRGGEVFQNGIKNSKQMNLLQMNIIITNLSGEERELSCFGKQCFNYVL